MRNPRFLSKLFDSPEKGPFGDPDQPIEIPEARFEPERQHDQHHCSEISN